MVDLLLLVEPLLEDVEVEAELVGLLVELPVELELLDFPVVDEVDLDDVDTEELDAEVLVTDDVLVLVEVTEVVTELLEVEADLDEVEAEVEIELEVVTALLVEALVLKLEVAEGVVVGLTLVVATAPVVEA